MMSLLRGIRYAITGLRWSLKKELRRYVLPPLLLNLAFLAGLIWLGVQGITPLVDWINGWMPDWLEWLDWLIIGLYFVLILWIGFLALSVVMHWMAIPFNENLARAVSRLQGQALEAPGQALTVKESIHEAGSRALYTLKWLLLIGLLAFVLTWIPAVNLLAPWLLFALSGWLLALEYFDYALALRGWRFPEQRQILAKNRLAAIGFGGSVALMLTIPVMNLLVIPAAVIGATLFTLNHLGEDDTP